MAESKKFLGVGGTPQFFGYAKKPKFCIDQNGEAFNGDIDGWDVGQVTDMR